MSQDDRQWYYHQLLYSPAVLRCGLCGTKSGERAIYCLEMRPAKAYREMGDRDEVLMVWLCHYHYMFSSDLFMRDIGHCVWGWQERSKTWPPA